MKDKQGKAVCGLCGLAMVDFTDCPAGRTVVFPDGSELPVIPWDGTVPCPDCAVVPGGYHHQHCDRGVCPKCGGQLMICLAIGCQEE